MLLGPGCLNYSLVLASRMELGVARCSLQPEVDDGPNAASAWRSRICAMKGDCDLALHDRKVSGNAQRRTQSAILHHGTILYKFDASRAERFLRPPHRQPAYRAGRSHRDFLGNVPLNAEQIRERLGWHAWC